MNGSQVNGSMGINLLIVDTDIGFRQSLCRHLVTAPFQVFESEGRWGLKKLIKKHNIDVVLLSLSQLREDGLALLKRIKRFRPQVEVILINGTGQLSLSIEGMKLGAFDDILVPFDLNRLMARIKDAHQRKQEKAGRSIFEQYQDAMTAAAFAEAGEPDMALEMLEKKAASAQECKGPKEE